ncbi:uncharacterized protein LOC134763162 [Penaeus indicus]|uniref:uncharacterized protein LOC134763162 n=1 Tax=Penaeus indicus TaxID=29960 RepID=UPI00300C42B1
MCSYCESSWAFPRCLRRASPLRRARAARHSPPGKRNNNETINSLSALPFMALPSTQTAHEFPGEGTARSPGVTALQHRTDPGSRSRRRGRNLRSNRKVSLVSPRAVSPTHHVNTSGAATRYNHESYTFPGIDRAVEYTPDTPISSSLNITTISGPTPTRTPPPAPTDPTTTPKHMRQSRRLSVHPPPPPQPQGTLPTPRRLIVSKGQSK